MKLTAIKTQFSRFNMDKFMTLSNQLGLLTGLVLKQRKLMGKALRLSILSYAAVFSFFAVAMVSSSSASAAQIILMPTVTNAIVGDTVIVLGDQVELSKWDKTAGLPCVKPASGNVWTCQTFTL